MVAMIGKAKRVMLVLGKLRDARNRPAALIAMFAGIPAAVTGIALPGIVTTCTLSTLSASTVCAVSAGSLATLSSVAAALSDRTRSS